MSYQKIEQVTRFALDGKGEALSTAEIVRRHNRWLEECARLDAENHKKTQLLREATKRLNDGEDLLDAIDRLTAERDKFRTRWVNAMGATGFFAMIAIVGSILVGAVMLGLVAL